MHTAGVRRRRPRDPVPATETGAKRQQKSRSSRSEHPQTPPATAEQRPSNIAASWERPQQQRSASTPPQEGGPAEQRWTAHRTSSMSAYKLALLCQQLISGKSESMDPLELLKTTWLSSLAEKNRFVTDREAAIFTPASSCIRVAMEN